MNNKSSLIASGFKGIAIEEFPSGKRIIKVKVNTPNCMIGEVIELPKSGEFKNLSNEEKIELIQGMISQGMKRNEIASYLDISESRISQLIGQKREKQCIIVEYESSPEEDFEEEYEDDNAEEDDEPLSIYIDDASANNIEIVTPDELKPIAHRVIASRVDKK